MLTFLRHIAKYTLWIANIIAVAALLCTLALPKISAQNVWLLGILGLVTPFIALANLVFIAIWMLLGKWRRMLLSVVAIILCWKIFSVACAGNIFSNNDMRYSSNALKVLSYNVKLLNLYGNRGSSAVTTRGNVLSFIKSQKPDIVCLQEFFDGTVIPNTDNIAYFKQQMQLPYIAYNVNITSKRGTFGDIIFSKYPIVQQQQVLFDSSVKQHHFQYADVVVRNDTFRVFNLHLQSIKLADTEVAFVDKKSISDVNKQETLNKSLGIIKKLKVGFEKRCQQADLVKQYLAKTKYPVIVCGDFNDLPTSYSYFTIRNQLGDAFLDKGFGTGRTFLGLSQVLRIDYILYSRQKLKTKGWYRPKLSYSDHFPVVANFEVKP